MKIADVAQAGSTLLALVAIVLAIASLRVARETVRVAQAQAWDYLGAQSCTSYRQEVLRLYELGMGREEIKDWFRKESADNPYSGEGAANAYEAFADGCGSVDDLLDLVERRDRRRNTRADTGRP